MAPCRSRAEGTTNLDHPTVLYGRYLRNHQADLVSGPGEDIMNLFYPSCLTSSYSLSLGNSTKCDHRTDSLSIEPFFSISHFVYTLLYVDAPIQLPQLLFSFLLNSFGFPSYTILPNVVHIPS